VTHFLSHPVTDLITCQDQLISPTNPHLLLLSLQTHFSLPTFHLTCILSYPFVEAVPHAVASTSTLVYMTYNAGMGGVDLMDRKIYQIAAERPCNKCWMKNLFNLVDIAVRNLPHSQWLHHCLLLCRMSAHSWVGRRRGIALCAVTGLQAFSVEAETGIPGVALVYTRSVMMGWNTAVLLVVISARPVLRMMALYYNKLS